MASGVYNQAKFNLFKKIYDFVNDTIKVALLNNSHSFSASATGYAGISANELAAAGGYTTGGATLATKAVTQDDSGNLGKFDADDTSWAAATFTAYHAVIWDDTPTSPADPLIASIDFGGAQQVTAGTFTIQWSASGILTIS